MSRIPVKELRVLCAASDVSTFRSLLRTRRVSTRSQETDDAGHLGGIPESASVRGRGHDDDGDGAAESAFKVKI